MSKRARNFHLRKRPPRRRAKSPENVRALQSTPVAVIRPELLDSFKDVRQGDTVEVQVQAGNAYLKFEARAEASGAVGDAIAVRNPTSGKRFLAKVQGKGQVFVDGLVEKESR